MYWLLEKRVSHLFYTCRDMQDSEGGGKVERERGESLRRGRWGEGG